MTQPRILDLFCCEGGAASGYHVAGYDLYGVDLLPKFKKRYPYAFTARDALETLWSLVNGEKVEFVHKDGTVESLGLKDFFAIHASPPCQGYSITKNSHNKKHPMLIEPTREALEASGKPYIIENVVGAPLLDATVLCWSMFREPGSVLDDDGTPLRMERHRQFETNWTLEAPRPCNHTKGMQVAGSYGYVPPTSVQKELLGINWMTQYGMYQSIPPMYTEFIGRQLRKSCE